MSPKAAAKKLPSSAATNASPIAIARENQSRRKFSSPLGLRRGERVLLLLLDSPEFLYCFFGAIKMGAIAVPVNPFQKAKDYEYVLNDSGRASPWWMNRCARSCTPYRPSAARI